MLRRNLVAPAALIAVAVSLATTAHAARAPRGFITPAKPEVTVMTRNLYLGADLLPIAAAGPGAPAQQAVAGALASLEASDPTARMRLVAREIAAAKPDLVGLQEASVWRTGPVGGAPDHVVVDYLKVIAAQLRALHAPYRIVSRHLSLDLRGQSSPTRFVDFQDGNAILARAGVRTTHVRSHDFRHLLKIDTAALGAVTVTRSYQELDARLPDGARLHFVNTHLEAYSPSVRLQQARELVGAPLKSHRRTVLVGDLNSGPRLPKPEDRPPYQVIARAGYTDERTKRFNCCFSDGLRGGRWDHIVDHVMVRPRAQLVRSYVTGRERTAAGLHPSDHGGVVSTLRLG